SDDSNLVLFLRRFNRSVEIFRDGGAVEFVKELHQRWMERHPASEARPTAQYRGVSPPAEMEPGAVFLSYASEDRLAVEKIKNALEQAGVDVFFDKEALHAGDLWEAKLQRKIRDCSLFVPVISRQTLAPGRRFFRVEWKLSLEEAQMFSEEE